MSKKRNKAIKKIICKVGPRGGRRYAVDKNGNVFGYFADPFAIQHGWACAGLPFTMGLALGTVKPFKGDGWKKHLYNPAGERTNQDG